jgi:cold shock CspA family protein
VFYHINELIDDKHELAVGDEVSFTFGQDQKVPTADQLVFDNGKRQKKPTKK